MNVLGVMNGTSVDAVDLVLCKIDPKKIKFLSSAQIKFPPLLRKLLLTATENKYLTNEISELSHELGRFYAKSISKLVTRKKWKVDLIGLHGQTVYHRSGKVSLQIGETSYLSHALGKPVISDFRVADIANGGQGAPLACIFHEALAKRHKLNQVAFHNLGGISNLTYISKKAKLSFDTGPANILMDLFCQKHLSREYDKNGTLAKQGVVDALLLDKMLKHVYFLKKPPKSCGREEFGSDFFKKYEKKLKAIGKENALATLCELTALSIADAYKNLIKLPVDEILFCGGGAKNSFLLKRISFYLKDIEITTTNNLFWNPQHVEAGAFAYLAWMRWKKKKIDLKPYTGGKKPILLGKITE